MTGILVTMFAVTSKAGQELARALETTLETMRVNDLPITVKFIPDGEIGRAHV